VDGDRRKRFFEEKVQFYCICEKKVVSLHVILARNNFMLIMSIAALKKRLKKKLK
jgi:hypothetical protein